MVFLDTARGRKKSWCSNPSTWHHICMSTQPRNFLISFRFFSLNAPPSRTKWPLNQSALPFSPAQIEGKNGRETQTEWGQGGKTVLYSIPVLKLGGKDKKEKGELKAWKINFLIFSMMREIRVWLSRWNGNGIHFDIFEIVQSFLSPNRANNSKLKLYLGK